MLKTYDKKIEDLDRALNQAKQINLTKRNCEVHHEGTHETKASPNV